MRTLKKKKKLSQTMFFLLILKLLHTSHYISKWRSKRANMLFNF